MSYIGDFAEDYATLNTKFTTTGSTGASTVLAGTPAISVYKANGTTQSTAGITLTVDFDSVVGMNNVLIDLSADAFYAVGNDYQVVITTGTVGGVSVVGYVVAEFSIENRFMRGTDSAALASVLASKVPNNLNTTATGNIGIDWANVENPTTALDLSATDIQLCDTVTTNTDAITVAGILTTQMTEAYAADGTAPTLAQAIFLIQQSLHEFAISSTTRTVKKLDGSTSAATFTLDDATSPTSTTRAT